MLNTSLLIIDEVHEDLILKLKENFKCVDYKTNITYSEFQKTLPKYQGLIIRSRFKLTAELLAPLTQLEWIGRYGAGLENIDTSFAQSKGIFCFNTPEGNCNAVAEHALGLLLNLNNKITKAQVEVQHGIWNRKSNWGTELEGQSIVLIGYGNTGTAFSKLLSGFGVKVYAYDKYKTIDSPLVTSIPYDAIFDLADVVSLHIPLTSETDQLVNETFINRFKKPFTLINTSRGPIVNTEALYQGLQNQTLKGACLDVIEYEEQTFESITNYPPLFQDLIQLPNVIFTPHIAGWSHQSYFKMGHVLWKKLQDYYHLT